MPTAVQGYLVVSLTRTLVSVLGQPSHASVGFNPAPVVVCNNCLVAGCILASAVVGSKRLLTGCIFASVGGVCGLNCSGVIGFLLSVNTNLQVK